MKRSLAILIALALIMAAMTRCKKEESSATATDTVTDSTDTGPEIEAELVPVRINVIADGFDSSARDKTLIDTFRITLDAVKNSHPFSEMPPAALKFEVPKRLEVAATLGITPKETGCYFDFAPEFQDRLTQIKKTLPPARITLVMVNVRPTLRVGACAIGRDLIVTSTQIGRHAIAHELGHAIGGLEDETTAGLGTFTPAEQTPHRAPNCSDNAASPGWELVQTSTATVLEPVPGCEGFSAGLVRPFDDCGMRSPGSRFCCVCTEHMIRHMSHLTRTKLSHDTVIHSCTVTGNEPPIDKSTPTNGWLVTVDYHSATNARQVSRERVTDFDAQMPLVAGDYYAGLAAGGNVISAVSLPNDPKYARAYAPGEANVDVRVDSPIPARVLLFVPDGTPAQLDPKLIELSGHAGVSLLNDRVRNDLKSKLQ